jgi:hypothetical protein
VGELATEVNNIWVSAVGINCESTDVISEFVNWECLIIDGVYGVRVEPIKRRIRKGGCLTGRSNRNGKLSFDLLVVIKFLVVLESAFNGDCPHTQEVVIFSIIEQNSKFIQIGGTVENNLWIIT